MTIVVIGPGAIGLLCAIRLASAGHAVALLGRPTTVARLAGQPLVLRQDGHTTSTTAITVISDPAALPPHAAPLELAVVCVKGYDTTSVLPLLDALAPQAVLTLQNGIGNEDVLAAHCGTQRVISGVTTTSVAVESPGQITVTKAGGIGLASLPGSPSVQRWASVFTQAGFPVQQYPDYQAMKWSKALLNILGNATPAILDMPITEVYADPRLVAVERQAFQEGICTMQRFGAHPINLPRYPAALLAQAMRLIPTPLLNPLLRRLIAGGRGGKLPSLHGELLNGNPRSEAGLLYGAIAARAEQLGVPAPVNRVLDHVLQGIASGQIPWDSYRKRPDALLSAIAAERGHA